MAVASPEKRRQAAALAELTVKKREIWRADPVRFAEERLGLTVTPDQAAVLESVRDNRRTFVKSANAVGKTFISSVVVAWAIECFEPAEVITTGPSFDQVRDALWKEIRVRYSEAKPKLRGRLLDKALRWEVSPNHFAIGRTATSQESFQGKHNPGLLLVILDEGPGVPEYIYTATFGMLKGKNGRLLTIGNPTALTGQFYDAFHSKSSINTLLTMVPRNHPNIVRGLEHLGITWDQFVAAPFDHYSLPDDWDDPFPGAVTLFDVDAAKVEWGVGTPSWDALVEGNFPTAGDRSVIPLAWIDQARWNPEKSSKLYFPTRLSDLTGRVAGLDIARFGEDRSCLVKMVDRKVVSIETWHGYELGHTAGIAAQAISDGFHLNYDEGGLGAAITSELKRRRFIEGREFTPNNAGGASIDPVHFMRMRDQLWFDTADYFRIGAVDLSELDEASFRQLKSELSAVEIAPPGPRGQRVVEKKDDTRKRLGRSPDIADAFNLALWRQQQRTLSRYIPQTREESITAGVLTERF